MAVRGDVWVDWYAVPRIIWVRAPSTDIILQDLVDTIRVLEAEQSNLSYDYLLLAAGKDVLGGGVYVGITVTLNNAVLAFEARLGPAFVQCNISGGNLVAVDENGDAMSPVYSTAYTQIIRTSSSSATLQELTQIQHASFNGVVVIDVIDGVAGTDYPVGTRQYPSNNLDDAMTILTNRGLETLLVETDLTVGATYDVSDLKFIGHNNSVLLTFTAGAITGRCEFENIAVTGTLDGVTHRFTDHCILDNIVGLTGSIEASILKGILYVAGTGASFIVCYDINPGSVEVNCGGAGKQIEFRDYYGGLKISNKTGSEELTINFSAGRLSITSTVTGTGTIVARGVGEISTNLGTSPVNDSGLVNYNKFTATTHRLIEGLRPHHTAIGTIFYWDPVNGDDLHDGLRPDTACATFTHIHDDLVTDWGHDVIYCYHGSPTGVTTSSENITISKNYVFLRGPGRAFLIEAISDGSPAVSVTGEGCEVSKVRVSTSPTSTRAAIETTGNFVLLQDLWVHDAVNGVLINGGEYTIAKNVKCHHNLGYGIKITGVAEHIDIDECHLSSNGGHGLWVDTPSGHEVNILNEIVIHGNAGWGIKIESGSMGVIINESGEVFKNTLGQILDEGINTYNGLAENDLAGAAAVWDLVTTGHTSAGSFGEAATTGGISPSVIADAVWDAVAADHVTPGTTGKNASDLVVTQATATTLIETLLKYQRNRTRVDQVAKQLIIYDDDTLTPIKIFDLKDFNGDPSVTEVAERVPV